MTCVIPEGRLIALDPLHLVRRKCHCVIPEDGVLALSTIPFHPMEEMPLFIEPQNSMRHNHSICSDGNATG